MATIVLIHGINNQDNSKENIEKTWRKAIIQGTQAAGLSLSEEITFVAAFYGDILFQETKSWQKNKASSQPMSTESPDEDYADANIASLYIAFQEKYGISDKQITKELDATDQVQSHQRQAKGIHKRWLKAIARVLEKTIPSASKGLAETFLRQAAAYLYKPGLKQSIDELVMTQIMDSLSNEDSVVIISHSLGTIIAYDLMRRLKNRANVNLLLTAGSPLGIEIVRKRLGPPLVCLPNVRKWVNVSDTEDFVALKPEITATTFGCDQVINIDEIDNGDENAHDILKYLIHGRVVEQIVSSL